MNNQNDVKIDMSSRGSTTRPRRAVFSETFVLSLIVLAFCVSVWFYFVHSFYLNHMNDEDIRKESIKA